MDSATTGENGNSDGDNVIDWNQVEKKSRARRRQNAGVDPDTPQWIRDIGGSYDPEKFYLKSTDGRGHQYLMSAIHLPQSFAMPLAVIREYYPEYRTNADIARDAIVHLLMMRMKQKEIGELTPLMHNEVYLSQMQYNLMVMQQRKLEVDTTKEALELAESLRDWDRLSIILETLEEKLEERREHDGKSPYWRDLAKMLEQYSGSLKRAKDKGEWTD